MFEVMFSKITRGRFFSSNNRLKNKFLTSDYKKDYNFLNQHEPDVISVIIGGILGDSHLRKRVKSTAISFGYSAKNMEYVQFLHKFFSIRGYCSENPLKIRKVKNTGSLLTNSEYLTINFETLSFKSFNQLHEMFYRPANLEESARNRRFIKIVPKNIKEYLTPLALAIWVQDDGLFMKTNRAFKLSTDGFLKEEVEILQEALEKNFNLKFNVLKAGVGKNGEQQFQLYLPSKQVPILRSLIKEHMVPTMLYKLGIDNEGNTLKAPIVRFNDVSQILRNPDSLNIHTFANWYVKNGSFNSATKRISLFLQDSVSNKEDVEKLQLLLKQQFKLEFAFDQEKHLTLSKEQLPLLITTLKPLIPQVFHFKFGLGLKRDCSNQVKKILQKNENLDVQTLAELNGSFEKNDKIIRLSTQGASKAEAETLLFLLEKKFNLQFTLNLKPKTQQWVLGLSRKNAPLLIKILKPHMLSSVYYKLGLGLNGEPLI